MGISYSPGQQAPSAATSAGTQPGPHFQAASVGFRQDPTTGQSVPKANFAPTPSGPVPQPNAGAARAMPAATNVPSLSDIAGMAAKAGGGNAGAAPATPKPAASSFPALAATMAQQPSQASAAMPRQAAATPAASGALSLSQIAARAAQQGGIQTGPGMANREMTALQVQQATGLSTTPKPVTPAQWASMSPAQQAAYLAETGGAPVLDTGTEQQQEGSEQVGQPTPNAAQPAATAATTTPDVTPPVPYANQDVPANGYQSPYAAQIQSTMDSIDTSTQNQQTDVLSQLDAQQAADQNALSMSNAARGLGSSPAMQQASSISLNAEYMQKKAQAISQLSQQAIQNKLALVQQESQVAEIMGNLDLKQSLGEQALNLQAQAQNLEDQQAGQSEAYSGLNNLLQSFSSIVSLGGGTMLTSSGRDALSSLAQQEESAIANGDFNQASQLMAQWFADNGINPSSDNWTNSQ